MLLAIDIGNTNTCFALFKGQDMQKTWRCETLSTRSADEYAVFLNQLFQMEGYAWKDISDVIIGSVVPDSNIHIERLCIKYIGTSPAFVVPEMTDLTIDLDHPEEIGADRLINAVAVMRHYHAPAIVVDFGTATTFDVIDRGGVYRGGVIAPGVRLSIEALTRRAAKLPRIDIEKPAHVIGKNTVSAMQSGLYWGYVGMIESIIRRIGDETGQDYFVLATGGLASLYAQSTDLIDSVDEDLMMKGLLEIHTRRRRGI